MDVVDEEAADIAWREAPLVNALERSRVMYADNAI